MEIRALSRNREENNILLAEDDREIRQGIEIFLRGQGYKVFQAADGLEGLAILEREEKTMPNLHVYASGGDPSGDCGYHDAAHGRCNHGGKVAGEL